MVYLYLCTCGSPWPRHFLCHCKVWSAWKRHRTLMPLCTVWHNFKTILQHIPCMMVVLVENSIYKIWDKTFGALNSKIWYDFIGCWKVIVWWLFYCPWLISNRQLHTQTYSIRIDGWVYMLRHTRTMPTGVEGVGCNWVTNTIIIRGNHKT